MSVYDINGTEISAGSSPVYSASTFVPDVSPSFYDKICKSINHRGWTDGGAVENSLAAYKASKTNGFYYVETDVRYTSDGYAVLYHDDYIDGTAVSNMTYAEALAAVPTLAVFEDFIALCRKICLHPYIEFKGTHTTNQVRSLVTTVHDYQMQHKVTWFGTNVNVSKVKSIDPSARLGILANRITSTEIEQAKALKLDTNEVFLDTYISYLTSAILASVKAEKLPLEVFTFTGGSSTNNEILAMDSYITGFTAGNRIAGKVLYDANIS